MKHQSESLHKIATKDHASKRITLHFGNRDKPVTWWHKDFQPRVNAKVLNRKQFYPMKMC